MNGQPQTLGGEMSLDARAQYSMLLRDLADAISRRAFDPVEQATRRQLAGVAILPPPAYGATLVAAGANTVIDLELPDSISIVTFNALATVEYYVSWSGRCVMPRTISQLSGTFLPNDGVRPGEGQLFYVRNIRRLSIGIAANAAVVSVMGWQQVS